MYKFVLALFFVFSSLSSIPVMASNCTGGSIVFNTDPSDRGYWESIYTAANKDPL